MLVHHETLIEYFQDQHISKDLGSKQKNHSKYLVGPAIEVEVPLVIGCIININFYKTQSTNNKHLSQGYCFARTCIQLFIKEESRQLVRYISQQLIITQEQ